MRYRIGKARKNLNMANTDIHYTIDSPFITLWPNNKHGEQLVREYMLQNGDNKIFSLHFDMVKKAIKKAGFTISKKPKSKPIDEDQLLAELAELGL